MSRAVYIMFYHCTIFRSVWDWKQWDRHFTPQIIALWQKELDLASWVLSNSIWVQCSLDYSLVSVNTFLYKKMGSYNRYLVSLTDYWQAQESLMIRRLCYNIPHIFSGFRLLTAVFYTKTLASTFTHRMQKQEKWLTFSLSVSRLNIFSQKEF